MKMSIVILIVEIKKIYTLIIIEVKIVNYHINMLVKILILFKMLYQMKQLKLLKVMIKDNVKIQIIKEFMMQI